MKIELTRLQEIKTEAMEIGILASPYLKLELIDNSLLMISFWISVGVIATGDCMKSISDVLEWYGA